MPHTLEIFEATERTKRNLRAHFLPVFILSTLNENHASLLRVIIRLL